MDSLLYRPRAPGSSADEEVDVATDLVHASLVDGAEVALDAVVGQGPDPLCHSNETPESRLTGNGHVWFGGSPAPQYRPAHEARAGGGRPPHTNTHRIPPSATS